MIISCSIPHQCADRGGSHNEKAKPPAAKRQDIGMLARAERLKLPAFQMKRRGNV